MAVKKLQKRTGRPRGFDEDEALERAMHVFWRKGFEGASLNDLTAAMGIQPTSLYRAFGNKRTLFQKALARYMAGPVAFVHDALNEPTAYAVANHNPTTHGRVFDRGEIATRMYDDPGSPRRWCRERTNPQKTDCPESQRAGRLA